MGPRLVLALLAALVVVPSAAAKGPVFVRICGESGCEAAEAAVPWHGLALELEGDPARPPAPAPFYRVDLVDARGRVMWQSASFYEPRSGLLTAHDPSGYIYWGRVPSRLRPLLNDLGSRVEPFPRPRLVSVHVGSRAVQGDPSSYLRLLSLEGPHTLPREFDGVLRIWLRASGRDPWSESLVLYYPRDDILQIGGSHFVRVSEDLAAKIERRRPLHAPAESSLGVPWVVVTIVATYVLVLVAARVRRPAAVRAAAQPS